jgi:hypothetical protein
MRTRRIGLTLFALCAALTPIALAAGCGGSGGNAATGGHAAGSGASGTGGASASSTGAGVGGSLLDIDGGSSSCTGLGCQVHSCPGGGATTVSGTVYDPAGNNPLYGVVVYVPNAPLAPLQSGAGCYACGDLYSGDPIAAAVTDANGNFTIKNAPDGPNIPLVVQIGKWRRQFTLPSVATCADTMVPDQTLKLPRNASEGDLPDIAISTGGADTLECLLTRVGVDPAEYVPGASKAGHVHVFKGTGGPDTSPGAPDPAQALWNDMGSIMAYDIVLLSCEGHETDAMNQQVLYDYAAAGGRVFASHYHYAWFNSGPFAAHDLATWYPGGNDIGTAPATVVTTLWDGTPFVRGQALHDWLAGPKVNALKNDVLPIEKARHNADVGMANKASQPWIVVKGQEQQAQDFTFDTPFGADAGAQCGRVAFSDMHVGAASGDYGSVKTTPQGCASGPLSPQEKALEFILFDLSSCVTSNNTPQDPPGEVH